MIFSNSNGKRPPLKVVAVLVARSGKPSALRRHPYATAVLTVAAAALSVFVVQWLFKFPLMIMFAAPAAICFPVLGVRPGLLALLLSVVVADFFFIEPLLTLTRHSFILGAYYIAAAMLCHFFTRKSIRRRLF